MSLFPIRIIAHVLRLVLGWPVSGPPGVWDGAGLLGSLQVADGGAGGVPSCALGQCFKEQTQRSIGMLGSDGRAGSNLQEPRL